VTRDRVAPVPVPGPSAVLCRTRQRCPAGRWWPRRVPGAMPWRMQPHGRPSIAARGVGAG